MVIVREPSNTQSGTCRKSNKQGQTNDVQKVNSGHLVGRRWFVTSSHSSSCGLSQHTPPAHRQRHPARPTHPLDAASLYETHGGPMGDNSVLGQGFCEQICRLERRWHIFHLQHLLVDHIPKPVEPEVHMLHATMMFWIPGNLDSGFVVNMKGGGVIKLIAQLSQELA